MPLLRGESVNRQSRHVVKSVLYRFVSLTLLITIFTAFGTPIEKAGGMSIIDALLSTLFYFVFEELWDIRKPLAHRTNRHIVKAMIYRAYSFLEIFTLSVFFGIGVIRATMALIVYEGLSVVMYFCFEETWDVIKERISNGG